ncbi:MAG: rhodanese-like domain-containing protein [Pseudomonadota bacterium]
MSDRRLAGARAWRWMLVASVVLAQPALARTIIGADDAHRLSSTGELRLFDIRSAEEWRETGVGIRAEMLTIHQPGGVTQFVKEMVAAVGGDLDRPVALICAAGGRSKRAYEILARHGFTRLFDVSEGMVGNRRGPGWIKRELPILPGPR